MPPGNGVLPSTWQVMRNEGAGGPPPSGWAYDRNYAVMSSLPGTMVFARSSSAYNHFFNHFAANVPVLTAGEGVLIQEQKTNIHRNHNVGQSALEGMYTESGMSLSLVAYADLPAGVKAAFDAQGFDTSVVQGVFRAVGGSGAKAFMNDPTPSSGAYGYTIFAHAVSGEPHMRFNGPPQYSQEIQPGFDRQYIGGLDVSGSNHAIIRMATAGSEVYFFGNQLEAGLPPTSPIVTSGAQTVRAADTLHEGWVRSGALTMEVTVNTDARETELYPRLCGLYDTGSDSSIEIFVATEAARVPRLRVRVNGDNQVVLSGTTELNGIQTVRAVCDSSDYELYVNGIKEAGSTLYAGVPPTTQIISTGYSYAEGFRQLCGYIRRLRATNAVEKP